MVAHSSLPDRSLFRRSRAVRDKSVKSCSFVSLVEAKAVERHAKLTSGWLVHFIREHGGAITVTRETVVD
jgi:hypothetical protein